MRDVINEAYRLVGILESFDILKTMVNAVNHKGRYKTIEIKLNALYRAKLDYPCRNLYRGFKALPQMPDEFAESICTIYEKYKDIGVKEDWKEEDEHRNTQGLTWN